MIQKHHKSETPYLFLCYALCYALGLSANRATETYSKSLSIVDIPILVISITSCYNPHMDIPKDILDQLTEKQKIFLASRTGYAKDSACAKALGLNSKTPWTWRNRSTAFRTALEMVNNVMTDVVASLDALKDARKRLENLAPKAVTVLDSFLDVDLNGEEATASKTKAAEKAAEFVLKGTGVAVERVEQDRQINIKFHEALIDPQKYLEAEYKVIEGGRGAIPRQGDAEEGDEG